MKNVFQTTIMGLMVILMAITPFLVTAQNSNFKLATSYEAYAKLYKDSKVKIARTPQQFSNMVKTNERLKAIFDANTLKAFMSKLKMGENGLITFSYESIKAKYPDNYKLQVGTILSVFGLGPIESLPVDYDGYYCAGSGTCSKSMDSICIGDNC